MLTDNSTKSASVVAAEYQPVQHNKVIYQVAVPSPLRRLFDYLPPEGHRTVIPPGTRVRVPFGRRELTGWVIEASAHTDTPHSKLKSIKSVIDEKPLIDPCLFALFMWAADYYIHPVGDAIAQCFPALLRKGSPIPANEERVWELADPSMTPCSVRGTRQQEAVQALVDGPRSELALIDDDVKPPALKQLQAKGIASVRLRPMIATPSRDVNDLIGEKLPSLYPDQAAAIEKMDLSGFSTWLIQGETGSGKTEVYFRLAEHVLRAGQQVLVLVPEINLTPQTHARFKQRFKCPVVSLHSGLTDKQRLTSWEEARAGRAGIVLGTRSAIFTPLARPGLIVIDEEHDTSYKQQEGFRYSARDLAVMRGYREGVPVVLGSATPSLETLNNVESGRYNVVKLARPLINGKPPEPWRFIDLRGKHLIAGFAPEVLDACEAELNKGNQVMVFINRRGFAPTLMCSDCGWVAECTQCDARLTVHKRTRSLICHHCDHRDRLHATCPRCLSSEVFPMGQGTEKTEEALDHIFPGFPVIRVDRDTTRRRDAMERIIGTVNTGEPCVLVGTQMLAKGHHFPNVTLVAILEADHGLYSSDFRGPERLGQLVTQVAGRAGRANKPGRVMIQTHHADHPLLAELSQNGYGAFAQTIMNERSITGLAPYRHMTLIRAESVDPRHADELLQSARQILESQSKPCPQLSLVGPLPSPMERRGGRFRFQISVMDEQRPRLHGLMNALSRQLEGHSLTRKVRWSIETDPVDLT